jgi:hypothetical protein
MMLALWVFLRGPGGRICFLFYSMHLQNQVLGGRRTEIPIFFLTALEFEEMSLKDPCVL